jgi:leucyl-tRNA synthetase
LYVTPPEETSDWTDDGISGRVRFINRVWRASMAALGAPDFAKTPDDRRELPAASTDDEKALLRAVHVAAKSAVDETVSRRFHYNTTVAKLDELVNALTTAVQTMPGSPVTAYAIHTLPVVIAPFAPHMAEELWERNGHTTSVHLEPYIVPDERAMAIDQITLVVQINGKIRARIPAEPGLTEDQAFTLALDEANVRTQVGDKPLRKRIYVQDKLLNLVV